MQLKKSLGQNFFNNPTLADKIVSYIEEKKPENIVEIGPGGGYFTERLIKLISNETHISLIEKDEDLYPLLKQKFPNAQIYNHDVLSFNFETFKILSKPVVCFGALPYNISKRIIQQCVESEIFSDMFFIIQKEVAYDYVNHSDKTSILYLMNAIYANTKLIMTIKPGAFSPQPKVDSALIHLTNRINPIGSKDELSKLERIIKQSFRNPRKTLRNNLRDIWTEKLHKYQSMRPEDLNLEDYLEISKEIDV